jgi:L-alanine-DL-glutamate epimerase-like enolase superfamily enzyme
MLGGAAQEALTLSWTVASADMAIVEEQLEEGRARGYRNFNIKVGAPQTPGYDLALARRVRAFAPDGFLWADANTGYDLDAALALAPKLADAGVDVLESPLPPNRISGYRALRRQDALPVLMDEGILSPVEVEEFIRLDMIDGIAMKPARCAGIRPSERIVRILKDRGLMILGSGLTDPDLALAAAVHVYARAGISYPCALNGPQFLADRLSGDTLVPDGDRLRLPAGPGLGLSLDARAERALRVVGEV